MYRNRYVEYIDGNIKAEELCNLSECERQGLFALSRKNHQKQHVKKWIDWFTPILTVVWLLYMVFCAIEQKAQLEAVIRYMNRILDFDLVTVLGCFFLGGIDIGVIVIKNYRKNQEGKDYP